MQPEKLTFHMGRWEKSARPFFNERREHFTDQGNEP